jgi:IMP dehydrogenase/GMP reductase
MDYSDRNRAERIGAAEQFGVGAFVTVRTSTKEQQVAREVLRHGGAICIEMANANVPRLVKMVRELKREIPHSFIMVGNVGSVEGYMAVTEAGADVVKLGRGPGAGCTTPEETGISPGQVTLAYECSMAQAYLLTYRGIDVPFILDGGISKPGHALLGALLGAETFMMGSFFAALDESPAPRVETSQGERVVYFGEASRFAQIISARTPDELERALQQKGQGIVGLLSPAGSYKDAVPKFLQGVRGGVADLNRTSMAEVAGTEAPMIARTIGMGAAHETGTRLESTRIEDLTLPGRFDLGVGGKSEFMIALGIDSN